VYKIDIDLNKEFHNNFIKSIQGEMPNIRSNIQGGMPNN